jgi:hypothetical protein
VKRRKNKKMRTGKFSFLRIPAPFACWNRVILSVSDLHLITFDNGETALKGISHGVDND